MLVGTADFVGRVSHRKRRPKGIAMRWDIYHLPFTHNRRQNREDLIGSVGLTQGCLTDGNNGQRH